MRPSGVPRHLHDARAAAGRRVPASPWHCPHHSDGRSPSRPLPLRGAGGRSPPAWLLPPKLWALGLPWLINTHQRAGCCRLWGAAGSSPARCHARCQHSQVRRSRYAHGHQHRTLPPSPEPAGQPGALAPITGRFGQDHHDTKSIPGRSQR